MEKQKVDNNNKMNIVVASDENYSLHLLTLIVSILENRKNTYSVVFYILDGGMNKKKKELITEIIYKYNNAYVDFIAMTDEIIMDKLGNKNMWRNRSLSTMSRLLIPELLKNEDKALYLDVDAVVKKDLLELYNTDIKDFCIAGVQDMCSKKGHEKIGLNKDDLYICAGLILWNLEVARSINFTEEVRKFILLFNGKVPAMDQGVINGVLSKKGLIKKIHPKYNVMTPFFFENSKQLIKIYDLTSYYSDNELKEACNSPVFIHYVSGGTTRPWEKHCKHPLRKEYWKYRTIYELGDNQLLSDKRFIKTRLSDWLYRNFPLLFVMIAHRR